MLIIFLSMLTNLGHAQIQVNFNDVNAPLNAAKLSSKLSYQLKAIGLEINPERVDLEILKSKIKQLETSKLIAKGRGGVDTGGGVLVTTPEGSGLLDLYLYNRSAFLSKDTDSKNILATNSFRKIGIEHIGNKKNILLAKVRQHLQKWREKSPLVVGQLLLALQNLPFYYVKGSLIEKPIEYYLPESSEIASSQLKLVALFRDRYGVQFGYDDLKSLPEKHQIALIIHECLRLVNFTGNLYLTNEKIQKLTAELINDPNEVETVDRPEFLEGDSVFYALQFAHLIYQSKYVSEDLCVGNKSTQSFCNFPDEKADLKDVIDFLWKGFTELYVLKQSDLSVEQRQALSQVYVLIIKGENMQLQSIMNVAFYSGKYLEVRTKFMSLDLLIDKMNNE